MNRHKEELEKMDYDEYLDLMYLDPAEAEKTERLLEAIFLNKQEALQF